MNIEGLGDRVAKDLVDRELVQSPADLYYLKVEHLMRLPGFAYKKAKNLYDAIQKSKKTTLARFLYALGIRHVGEATAQLIAEKFKTLDKIMNATMADLTAIPGIGPEAARAIVEFFRDEENRHMVQRLLEVGITFVEEGEEKVEFPKVFEGKTFVFTGTLKSMTREKAKELVQALGGKASDSVSRNVDFVVVGEAPGSKYQKALQLGVKIINEEEFLNMIKQAIPEDKRTEEIKS